MNDYLNEDHHVVIIIICENGTQYFKDHQNQFVYINLVIMEIDVN